MKPRILYLSKNDGSDVRVIKECNSLVKAGYQVCFVGWRRVHQGSRQAGDQETRQAGRENSSDHTLPGIEKYIFTYQAGFETPWLMFSIWRYILFARRCIKRFKPAMIHAVNEDCAFIAMLTKNDRRVKVICDVFDSLSFRYQGLNKGYYWLLQRVCRLVWHRADGLIVTDDARAQYFSEYRHKLAIIPNYPVPPSFSVLDIKQQRADDQLMIYFGGSIHRSRGLHLLAQALAVNADLAIVCAGWIYDDEASEFLKLQGVRYLGVLSPEESLRQAALADALFAFYEPDNLNHRLASPNKRYDGLCVGTPLLANEESGFAKRLDSESVGYSCGYHDFQQFNKLLQLIREWQEHRQDHARRLMKMFHEDYSWHFSERRLLQLYDRVAR